MKRNGEKIAAVMRVMAIGGLLALASCAGRPSTPKAGGEVFGPARSATETAAAPAQGPPAPETARSVTLILGPGMAHSLAGVGVLQALHERGIQVTQLVGIEMGSVIAALYGASANLGTLEWDLMKLKLPETLAEGSWVGKLLSLESRRAQLRKNFEKTRPRLQLQDTKVPVAVLLEEAAGLTWIQSGGASETLERAVFPDRPPEGAPADRAALADRIYSAVQARYPERRVWVGFAPPRSIPAPAPEFSEDTWIQPDFRGIAPTDFGRRNEIVFRGKQAALSRLKGPTL